MNAKELIALMDLRFKSGNEVPVERAYIKANEWAAMRALLANEAKENDDGR